ncbi:hypothetical protein LT337_13715 [Mycolicibacterium fortuitum]|nr:hypothetical protein LT337_13715 [Mycolicibacterium fortuitum]
MQPQAVGKGLLQQPCRHVVAPLDPGDALDQVVQQGILLTYGRAQRATSECRGREGELDEAAFGPCGQSGRAQLGRNDPHAARTRDEPVGETRFELDLLGAHPAAAPEQNLVVGTGK